MYPKTVQVRIPLPTETTIAFLHRNRCRVKCCSLYACNSTSAQAESTKAQDQHIPRHSAGQHPLPMNQQATRRETKHPHKASPLTSEATTVLLNINKTYRISTLLIHACTSTPLKKRAPQLSSTAVQPRFRRCNATAPSMPQICHANSRCNIRAPLQYIAANC